MQREQVEREMRRGGRGLQAPPPVAIAGGERLAPRSSEDALLAIGHDLRSPLAAAELTIRSLLARGCKASEPAPIPDWAAGRLLLAADGLRGLSVVLGDIIDMARSGPRRRGVVDLRQLIEETVLQLATSLQEAGCTVVLSYDGTCTGRWERGPLHQIVANLTTNAMKHGAGRPIHVRITPHGGWTRLEVRNGGPAIAESQRRTIFEKFTRLRRSAHIEGYGLGLWIAARAARRLRARIAVESDPRRGTSFVVELPPTRARHGPRPAPRPEAAAPRAYRTRGQPGPGAWGIPKMSRSRG